MSLIHFEINHASRLTGFLDRLEALLLAGADPNALVSCGELPAFARVPPLASAASRGLVAAAALLLRHGAHPDGPAQSPFPPPLFCAVSDEFSKAMVDLLLASGARPDAATSDGLTPLHAAAIYNRPDAVSSLIDAGADFRLSASLANSGFTAEQIGRNNQSWAFLAALEAARLTLEHPPRRASPSLPTRAL